MTNSRVTFHCLKCEVSVLFFLFFFISFLTVHLRSDVYDVITYIELSLQCFVFKTNLVVLNLLAYDNISNLINRNFTLVGFSLSLNL